MNVSRSLVIGMGVLLISSGTVQLSGLGTVQATSVASPDATVPNDGPAYGVNSSVYYRLWSDDVDDNNRSLSDFENGNVSSRGEFESGLAQSTDIPFDNPPQAVEDWNSGDAGDYSPGGRQASVAPKAATLTDGTYLKDAFVSIVAVQPSTFLHRGNQSNTSQFVAPDGTVHSVSDYRVVIPKDDTKGGHRERWSLSQSSVENVRLTTGNRTLSTKGSHQANLRFENLAGSPTLTVEADVTATLKQVIRDCSDWNSSANSCDGYWKRTVNHPNETVTVSDSQTVTVNRLTNITGKRVAFAADGSRRGAVVHPDTEWSTITVEGDVRARSNWWFYTASKPGWVTMVTHTATGASRSNSSVRPLQVHAFPSVEAPHVPTQLTNGTVPLTIAQTWGPEQPGPTLPSAIDLESASPYENANSIAVSSETLDSGAFREVTVDGIVRGQSRTVTLPTQQTVREVNLSLSVIEQNATHAVVRATVSANATGDAIAAGQVTIRNTTTAVNSSGIAVLTIQSPGITVTGEYIPEKWWRTNRPYASATEVAKTPGEFPGFTAFIRLVVVTILWFIPVALLVLGLDYVVGGELLGLDRHS